MPTYEYECRECGHQMEQFQGINAVPLKKCPACGRLRLRRLLGAGAGILFKGSGFYQTDYRSASYASRARSETSGKTDGGAGSSSKTGAGTAAPGKQPAVAKTVKSS